jgi:hypothetical protein
LLNLNKTTIGRYIKKKKEKVFIWNSYKYILSISPITTELFTNNGKNI